MCSFKQVLLTQLFAQTWLWYCCRALLAVLWITERGEKWSRSRRLITKSDLCSSVNLHYGYHRRNYLCSNHCFGLWMSKVVINDNKKTKVYLWRWMISHQMCPSPNVKRETVPPTALFFHFVSIRTESSEVTKTLLCLHFSYLSVNKCSWEVLMITLTFVF